MRFGVTPVVLSTATPWRMVAWSCERSGACEHSCCWRLFGLLARIADLRSRWTSCGTVNNHDDCQYYLNKGHRPLGEQTGIHRVIGREPKPAACSSAAAVRHICHTLLAQFVWLTHTCMASAQLLVTAKVCMHHTPCCCRTNRTTAAAQTTCPVPICLVFLFPSTAQAARPHCCCSTCTQCLLIDLRLYLHQAVPAITQVTNHLMTYQN